jgi:hypothetical protein
LSQARTKRVNFQVPTQGQLSRAADNGSYETLTIIGASATPVYRPDDALHPNLPAEDESGHPTVHAITVAARW